MSLKSMLCHLVSLIGFISSIIFFVMFFRGAPEPQIYLQTAVSLLVFSFFAFIGARIVGYCDDSLAIKEQMLEIEKRKERI